MSIASRFPVLAERRTTNTVAQPTRIKAEPVDTSMQEESEADDGGMSEEMDTASNDDSFDRLIDSVSQCSSTGSAGIACNSTGSHADAPAQPTPPVKTKDRATQTATPPSIAVVNTASATSEADVRGGGEQADSVPVSMPTAAQDLVERKLRDVQTVSLRLIRLMYFYVKRAY